MDLLSDSVNTAWELRISKPRYMKMYNVLYLVHVHVYDIICICNNMRYCDGDKPSSLSGISLATSDSNLHQHG